jgi:N-acyl-L-homoserine lactone synthetase
MGLEARPANSHTERAQLFRFRYRIYVEEQRLSPAGADHVGKTLCDPLDAFSTSYALWSGSEVVGSLRLTYLTDVPDIGPLLRQYCMGPALESFGLSPLCASSRFMFDERFAASKGVFRLMAAAYQDAVARGIRIVYGNCSPPLLSFYLHLGYRVYSAPFSDPSYGPKVPLLMLGRDREQFHLVGSPLRRLAALHPTDLEARAWFGRTYGEPERFWQLHLRNAI